MADNIQEHSSKLKHAVRDDCRPQRCNHLQAHLIEHKEQRLSQSKYQPLQLNLDKMKQMLLAANEVTLDMCEVDKGSRTNVGADLVG